MVVLNSDFCQINWQVTIVNFGKCMYQNFHYETGNISFMFYEHASTCIAYVSLKQQVELLLMLESKFIFGSQTSWDRVETN